MRNNTFMFITNKFYFCFTVQFNLNYLHLLLLSQFFKNKLVIF